MSGARELDRAEPRLNMPARQLLHGRTVPMHAHPGLMITDALRLDRHLADGGMSSLWLADDLELGTRVVVKFPMPQAGHTREIIDRFRREAAVTARITNAHVVRVYRFIEHVPGLDPPVPCLVLELLEGEDLESRLRRLGTLSVDETVEIVDQVASALLSAHAQGIIHRDVKPDNIFVDSSGERCRVKLLDFGVARLHDAPIRLTAAGMAVGTPMFMSPEQLLDPVGADARCDVWSLAVVAYTCLTGRPPLQGGSFGEICVGLQKCEFEPPSRRRPALPESIDRFFARALNRRIDERPGTPAELSALLREATSNTAPEPEEMPWPLVTRKAHSWRRFSRASLAADPLRPGGSGGTSREMPGC
jgi:serine/threonine protein kinase